MASDILQEFKKDDMYAPFLEREFDPKVHASHLVQGVTIAEHLNKLDIGVKKLEKEIENQVGDHYEDLLSQASGVETLEDTLNTMHGRIQTLQAGVERLRARIVEPYNQIAQQTLILRNIQPACELLRRIIRCLSLSQRLKEQLANGPKDITKAASSLRELDDIEKTMDLSGIDILEKPHRMIRQARYDVEKQATLMMDKGMDAQNQSQVATSLQVFHNLGILHSSVDKVMQNLLKNMNKNVASALDVNYLTQLSQETKKGGGPGKALMPTLGQSAQFRANLWVGLEKVMDDIYNICVKTSHLHKVLAKKKDLTTHVCFKEEIEKQNKMSLFTLMWKNVTKILTEEFAKASKESTLIHQALEVDYPKLLRLYGDLWKKVDALSSDMRILQSSSTEAVISYPENRSSVAYGDPQSKEEDFDPEIALRNSLLPLEKAYISRSLSRLFDAVNLMFSTPGTAPSRDEVATLLKTIISELNLSAIDKSLSEIVAKNVAKTLQLFCQKCEHLLATDGEASQVIGPPTSGQKLNTDIVNQLINVNSQVERMANATLAHLPQVLQILLKTLPSINDLISSAVDPLFSSLRASTEAIILTMHKEDFSSNEEVVMPEGQCSLYMKELQNFLSRVATDYVEPFSHSPVIKEKVTTLCCFTLEMFVRQASLLRPLGEKGKFRLATDFAQMESAITSLAPRPTDLGRPYRILRAFRPLLFQTPEYIASAPSVGDVLPYSTVLHFLFARAPQEMRSPHQTAGWSQARYSGWLDDHPSERERLLLVEGALEAYVASVRARHDTHFHPLYPVMRELLEKGFERVGTPSSLRPHSEKNGNA